MTIDFSFLGGAIADAQDMLTSLAQQERSKEGVNGTKDNPDEAAATDDEIANTKFIVTLNGNNVSGHIETSGSNWDMSMDSGVSGTVLGGSGGTVTLPDGSTRPSNVPPSLWGNPVPSDYEAEGSSVWRENVMTMVRTLLPDIIREAVNESKREIAEQIKPEIASMIGGALS